LSRRLSPVVDIAPVPPRSGRLPPRATNPARVPRRPGRRPGSKLLLRPSRLRQRAARLGRLRSAVRYRLTKPLPTGQTEFTLTPLELLDRLAALIPLPRLTGITTPACSSG